MRGLRKITVTTALLMMALVPIVASISPEAAAPTMDSRMPVAMAQPLAAVDGAPLVTVRRQDGSNPMLSESALLVLVGSALFGLAAIVRRTT
jgi:hypothetical protein